ncbi:MAG: hypothetical protein WA639_21640 [Candidatus Acidiferrum sp.]
MTLNLDAGSQYIPLPAAPSLKYIASAHPEVIEELKRFEPIATAAAFASLLTIPQLQSNCFRIEALVHLAIAYCQGASAPTQEVVLRAFEQLGRGICGRMEDPAEDVFVSLVNTSQGNFRIFEGLNEGAGFYLQRILQIVEKMPTRPRFERISSRVNCLLQLSDEVAGRAGVRENQLGEETPVDSVSQDVTERLAASLGGIRFHEQDLAKFQVSGGCLDEFVFDLERRQQLVDQHLGHTDLERRPLVFKDGYFFLLLPTAISSAIRRFVIEFVDTMGQTNILESALAIEYSELFGAGPILGHRFGPPIQFKRLKGGGTGAVTGEVDPGRFLHLVFLLDGLDEFLTDGFNGFNSNQGDLSVAVAAEVDWASTEAKKHSSFQDGISLIVSCGYGRGFGIELDRKRPDKWRVEAISAYDLSTLNWVHEFKAVGLWRLLDARSTLARRGLALLNVNGLLNLVAWVRRLEGHIVPHGRMPDEFGRDESHDVMLVEQNAIRSLRHEVFADWDSRRVLDVNGRWIKVRKLDRSEFEEDLTALLYGSEEDVLQGRLRAVYVADRHAWWVGISAEEESSRGGMYEYWMMLCVWLRRAAPILDDAYPELPSGPLDLEVKFAEILEVTRGKVKPKNGEELWALLKISADAKSPRMHISVGKGFDDGLLQPENIAERCLVAAIVSAVAIAAGDGLNEEKKLRLTKEICPNTEARHRHRFEARSFRDHLRSEIPREPELIDKMDDATSRIGLGWRVRSRESGSEVTGVAECTALLNQVVKVVLDDLCRELRELNRKSFVNAVLLNHEATATNRDIWKQTTKANLALHEDKQAALRTITMHHGHLNASFLATRLLLEAAVCECPLVGGREPGELELSRTMCHVLRAHHLGGWSDAIHWGAMEPRVKITPLGDVFVNHNFIDKVYEPFGREAGEAEVKRAAESYGRLYAPSKVVPAVTTAFEQRFLDAWNEEFGCSLDAMRAFIDKLENLGIKRNKAVYTVTRSDLVGMLRSVTDLDAERASLTLSFITTLPRAEWRVVSIGFSDKDWVPWRFGRRLSVLRRPLIQVDEQVNPSVFIAPGLVRDALYVIVRSFHSGEVPSSQVSGPGMRKWIGHANNVQRSAFNATVAERMRELGWLVEKEIKLTQILGRPLDRNYGDVDVLAWKPSTGRVLAMECKDVQYNKTLGQVAEQLSDFLGVVRRDGKRDLLRKHLDRLEILNANKSEVAKSLKMSVPAQLEGHLIFRNLVPMRFAWERMASKVRLSLFEELDQI